MKLYSELAKYYFNIEEKERDINNDISLIKSLSNNTLPPTLLDLGCGSGEHINRLSKEGFSCVGIDKSPLMIQTAKSRFPDIAEFKIMDMINIKFFNKFDIIISLFGSFNYIIEDTSINKVLLNTCSALKKNGTAIFEIWNTSPLKKLQSKTTDYVSTTNYKGIKIKRKRNFKFLEDGDKTIVEINYLYTILNERVITIKDKHIMRTFTQGEINRFINNNGFKINAFYSNSKRELYNKFSNRLLIHFEKKHG